MRLLPGDPAPALKFAPVALNGREPVVTLARFNLIVLWTTGCGACPRAIRQASALSDSLGVQCLAVAIMVRDGAEVAAKAAEIGTSAHFLIEQPPGDSSYLQRGWIAEHWFEASGRNGVPVAFVLDDAGTILWLGNPFEIAEVLPRIAGGQWDTASARDEQLRTMSRGEAAGPRYSRDLMDKLAAQDLAGAERIAAEAEAAYPDIIDSEAYCLAKIAMLSGIPARREAAFAMIAEHLDRWEHDATRIANVASWAMFLEPRHQEALELAAARLEAAERRLADCSDVCPIDDQPAVSLHLVHGEVLLRLGRFDAAASCAAVVAATLRNGILPDAIRAWTRERVDQIAAAATERRRGSIGIGYS
jgi:hypothetical protein